LQRSGGRGTTRGRARKHTARAAATHRTPKPPRNAAGASRATAVRRKPSAVRGRTTEVTIQHTNIEAVPPHTNNTSAGARASVWRGTRGNAVGVCKRLYHPPYPSWHCSHWEREGGRGRERERERGYGGRRARGRGQSEAPAPHTTTEATAQHTHIEANPSHTITEATTLEFQTTTQHINIKTTTRARRQPRCASIPPLTVTLT